MQKLAQELWRLAPHRVDLTVGELAYQAGMAKSLPPETPPLLRLWMNNNECLGWGWLSPRHTLEYAFHPGYVEVREEILDWFDSESRSEAVVHVSVREADQDTAASLVARGFIPDPGHIWMRLNYRSLERVDDAELPSGFVVRTVADSGGDISKRVEVHQRSWAELGTRVSMETYPHVMQTWPYRDDLDFVLEDRDGIPVAFALGWYDEQNALGEFEPVGTDPGFRGRGLGRALLCFGMKRFRDIGATSMVVASRGDSGHPSPSKLYESVGFREFSRQRWFIRDGSL
jgi:GNAT superfamily N-acetyltransferase